MESVRSPRALTLRGKSEGLGRAGGKWGGPGAHRHTRPQMLSRGPPLSPSAPGGLRAGCQGRGGLQASDAAADPRTGRPPAPDAGSPTGLSPAAGKRFRALRVSSGYSQPCGSRTRRSCCNGSQDRPIVLARSRLLSPRSARPGPPWTPAPWLCPA